MNKYHKLREKDKHIYDYIFSGNITFGSVIYSLCFFRAVHEIWNKSEPFLLLNRPQG